MKKLTMFLTMLVVPVLLSALPAFSSSGPFGIIGPSDYTDSGNKIELSHNTTVSGTGPYGAFGFFNTEQGKVSKHTATSGGSGPYGTFTSNGMLMDNWSKTVENKDGCILVANNCPTKK